jgi:hypothetical protein
MRSLLNLLMLCLLVFCLVGCGESTPPPEEDTAANPTPEMSEIPPPDPLPAE